MLWPYRGSLVSHTSNFFSDNPTILLNLFSSIRIDLTHLLLESPFLLFCSGPGSYKNMSTLPASLSASCLRLLLLQFSWPSADWEVFQKLHCRLTAPAHIIAYRECWWPRSPWDELVIRPHCSIRLVPLQLLESTLCSHRGQVCPPPPPHHAHSPEFVITVFFCQCGIPWSSVSRGIAFPGSLKHTLKAGFACTGG